MDNEFRPNNSRLKILIISISVILIAAMATFIVYISDNNGQQHKKITIDNEHSALKINSSARTDSTRANVIHTKQTIRKSINEKTKFNVSKPYTLLNQSDKFGEIAEMINRRIQTGTDADKKEMQVLQNELIASQKATFPRLRENYGLSANKLMSADSITVVVAGSQITFIGHRFALEENCRIDYRLLYDQLYGLRFKRATYRVTTSDTPTKVYNINSPKDTDIVSNR
ncbi:MAG: hypothetical protein LBO69_08725 [Ignavibacteria bacterium]|jgi:hypothetical protein|nr:hypothetical protein [Ignavibacteria bacterium]